MFEYNTNIALRNEILMNEGEIEKYSDMVEFTIDFEGLKKLIDNNFIDPNIKVSDYAPSVSKYVEFYKKSIKNWKDAKLITFSGYITNLIDTNYTMYINFIVVGKKEDDEDEYFDKNFVKHFEETFSNSDELIYGKDFIYSFYNIRKL